MTKTVQVLIVDDHPAVREGLAARLATTVDLTLCGEADGIDAALQVLDAGVEPDLAVVDIVLPDGSGIDLVKQLRARRAAMGILVWSMYQEQLYALRALRAGAAGYLDKRQATDAVVQSLRKIASGQTVFPTDLESDRPSKPTTDADIVTRLSNRELQVFRLIGQGQTTAEIAQRLGVSVKTVETHRQRIKIKLRFRNSVELSRRAVQWVLENG